jgi:hypothetical protein
MEKFVRYDDFVPKKKKELCARSRGGLDDTLSFS